MKKYFLAIIFLSSACSNNEHSQKQVSQYQNQKGEYLYRHHNEKLFIVPPPKLLLREPYPWERNSSLRPGVSAPSR